MDRLYSLSRELLSGPFGHIFLSLSAFISECTFLASLESWCQGYHATRAKEYNGIIAQAWLGQIGGLESVRFEAASCSASHSKSSKAFEELLE